MTHGKFLAIALSLAVIPALAVMFLPEGILNTYIDVCKPVTLFVGSVFALLATRLYRRQLRTAFVCFAAYMFLFMVALLVMNYDLLPASDTYARITLFATQLLIYVMLVLFFLFLLRSIHIRQVDGAAWAFAGATLVLSLFVALYPPIVEGYWVAALPNVFFIMSRVLDALLVTFLVPAVWLYIQYLRSQSRQSLTVTAIIAGITIGTLFDYLFESIVRLFPVLSETSMLHYTIPNVLYIYGAVVMVAGLYAHLKADEWGFKAIERALG